MIKYDLWGFCPLHLYTLLFHKMKISNINHILLKFIGKNIDIAPITTRSVFRF